MPRTSPALLDNFWLRMAGMFGHTWVSQYGASPTGIGGDTWSAALADLTGKQVAQGMSACLASGAEWPPSAPRFRAMCLLIPSLAMVEAALYGRTEATAFSRLVWSKLDTHRFRTESTTTTDRLIRDAYEIAKEHVMRGGALPDDPVALIEQAEPEPHVPASAETAQANIEKIRHALRIGDDHDPR